MAKLNLKSDQQILGDMITTMLAESGLNDINRGSVLRTLLEAASQEDFAQYVQMSQIVRNYNIDTTTGEDLDNRGFEYGLTRNPARKASGNITIQRPEGFEKVSTTLYSGLPSPLAGDTVIRVNDASNILFGSSGTLIVGRGTINEEEVSYTSAPTNFINYWEFTVSAFTKDHGAGEFVILKQGNDEFIPANSEVIVPESGSSAEIVFRTVNDETLLSGEAELLNVEVLAEEAGAIGNIPIKAIEGEAAFTSAPFAGARAENTSKFTSGRDYESDDDFRDRIKDHIQSISKGTKEAILNAIVGLVDEDTAKRVVSASIILPQTNCDPTKIYIDDGTGFEPNFEARGFESVIDNSSSGEQRLQIDNFPLVKAQVESNLAEPYNFSAGNYTLSYQVGTSTEAITFEPDEFEFSESATAEEVVTLINDKSTLLEARTSEVGTKIVLSAKSDFNEDLQILSGGANTLLQFPTDSRSTLYLYIDDVLQSKDGVTAFIDSGNQATYNFSAIGAFPHDLVITVDGKTANLQTVTFNALDFSDVTAITAEELVTVINSQVAGATATSEFSGTKVRLTSNTELSESSKLRVVGGSANNATFGLNFDTTEVVGVTGDYKLNRELGMIELAEALGVGQVVTASSIFTRASLRASSPENYILTNGTTLIISIDGASNQTITFDTTFTAGGTAQQVADYINNTLIGGAAVVRSVNGLNYLEIRTNSFDLSIGTVRINSASTANSVFGFLTDTTILNQRPHQAYIVSQNPEDYNLLEGDTLVAVLDDDSINKTFSVLMDYSGSVTAGNSVTEFINTGFLTVFTADNELEDYYAVFKSGDNTSTGDIASIVDQGSSTFRINFDSAPANLSDFAINDQITISDATDAENDGKYLITAIDTAGNGYVEITNPDGIEQLTAAGSVLLQQRRRISNYDELTQTITLSSALRATPITGDDFTVIPSTIVNCVGFFNNLKISSISLAAFIEGAFANSKLQISSKSSGSDGYVQIAGGKANTKFNFLTDSIRGLEGYNYYTGLTKLVHRTIYGDDSDLVAFPGIGAAGVQFQILAPTVREVSVNLEVTLAEGVSISNVENEIRSRVSEYINGLGVSQDVVIEEIRAAVISIRNIRDVELQSPSENIAIADNEIARTKNSLITIG